MSKRATTIGNIVCEQNIHKSTQMATLNCFLFVWQPMFARNSAANLSDSYGMPMKINTQTSFKIQVPLSAFFFHPFRWWGLLLLASMPITSSLYLPQIVVLAFSGTFALE